MKTKTGTFPWRRLIARDTDAGASIRVVGMRGRELMYAVGLALWVLSPPFGSLVLGVEFPNKLTAFVYAAAAVGAIVNVVISRVILQARLRRGSRHPQLVRDITLRRAVEDQAYRGGPTHDLTVDGFRVALAECDEEAGAATPVLAGANVVIATWTITAQYDVVHEFFAIELVVPEKTYEIMVVRDAARARAIASEVARTLHLAAPPEQMIASHDNIVGVFGWGTGKSLYYEILVVCAALMVAVLVSKWGVVAQLLASFLYLAVHAAILASQLRRWRHNVLTGTSWIKRVGDEFVVTQTG